MDALAASHLVPVTITVLVPGEQPVTFTTNATPKTKLFALVNQLAEATNRVVISGTNPTWDDPDAVVGNMLLQVGRWRNIDMPEDPTFPSRTLPDSYWMIIGGPSTQKRRRRIVALPSQEIVHGQYIMNGPSVSLESIEIDWQIAQGTRARKSPPQYVLWLGNSETLPQ
jgi:hypothetical protein